jgi:Ca2+-binding EF-hand superfamily protein
MKRCCSAVVLCLVVSLPAWAQPPQDGGFPGPGEGTNGQEGFQGRGRFGPPPNLMFQAIDTDGDGVITVREMRKAVVALKTLDTNGDGNLTLEEVTPRGGPGGGPGGDPNALVDRIFQSDRNGDGFLTSDEISERLAPMLQGADTNNDGKYDRAEVTAAMENARARFGRRGGFGDPQQMTQQLMQGDRNGDGKLTPDEVSPRARAMLQGADTNGDGAIDAQELQAVYQRMSERRGGGYGRGPQGNPNGPVPPQQP